MEEGGTAPRILNFGITGKSIASPLPTKGGGGDKNYRGPKVRKGACGHSMLHMLLSFSVVTQSSSDLSS